jgi:retinol dehydrogenase 12
MQEPMSKHIVITGATDGIGRESALQLARIGHSITFVARNSDKADILQKELLSAGSPKVNQFICDLSLMNSISQLSEQLLKKLEPIDILMNNAGAFFSEEEKTAEGLEKTFALNHLNYFHLTNLILPLVEKANGRIVNVASRAHNGPQVNLLNIEGAGGYKGWRAYQQSKLCNVLFTREIARRLEEKRSSVLACSLHPGFVETKFGHNNTGFMRIAMQFLQKVMAISVYKGAKTQVFLASTHSKLQNGGYYSNSKLRLPSNEARDEVVARDLWELSEDYLRRVLN